jgi:small subunit ribosomal protein S16
MVVIRLSRGGAKKRPFYHIVVSDKRNARDGRRIECIGYFNPIASGKDIKLHLNYERAEYWISKGAQPSDRVRQLIKTFKKEPQAQKGTKEETVQ